MPKVTTVSYDGSAIKDRREYLGYTLEDMAGKTGRSIYTLSDIERNRHSKVSKMIIGQIARALESKPEDFLKATQDAA
jgi:transcriptional regulator with XRE-family HTH domain